MERDNRCPICRKIEPLQQPQNTYSSQEDHLTFNADRPRASSYSHPTTTTTNRQTLPNINLRRRYNNYIVPLNNYVDPQAKNRIYK